MKRERGGDQIVNQAAEIALRAKRRAGELLAELPGLQQGGDRKSSSKVLLDPSISKIDSSRWQAVAAL
jgi:hypothetical protein